MGWKTQTAVAASLEAVAAAVVDVAAAVVVVVVVAKWMVLDAVIAAELWVSVVVVVDLFD